VFCLIDTHCHLTSEEFAADLDQVLLAAQNAGIEKVVVPSVDIPSSYQALELATRYSQLYAAVGIQPEFHGQYSPEHVAELESLARSERVVAVGEIGLDFHYQPADAESQKRVFFEMLNMAARVGKPVLIHSRDAMESVLQMITKWADTLNHSNLVDLATSPGIIHAFEGNLLQAKQAVSLHFALGVGGPITYKNASLKRAVFESISLDHLVLETDSPYLPPQPFRGRRNEPANLKIIAEKLSEISHQPAKVIAEKTTACAQNIFKWEE